jgi:hypothetical protein
MRSILLSLLLLLILPTLEAQAQTQQGAQSIRKSKCLRGWPLAMRRNNLRPTDRGEWLQRCRSGAFDSHGGAVR